LKIIPRKTDIANLEPGDIYAEAGPGEWAMLTEGWDERVEPRPAPKSVIGHPVFIRSNDPLPEMGHKTVYRLEIVKDE
jgi:hypothetical protein